MNILRIACIAVMALGLFGCQEGCQPPNLDDYCDKECPAGFRTDAMGNTFCQCLEPDCDGTTPNRPYRYVPQVTNDYDYEGDERPGGDDYDPNNPPPPAPPPPDNEPPHIDPPEPDPYFEEYIDEPGECVWFESTCDIPQDFEPCDGCARDGRFVLPGDALIIDEQLLVCTENGTFVLGDLPNPQPEPEPEPIDPGFCIVDGYGSVDPGVFVHPGEACQVCDCDVDGSVQCDRAACFVCDENNGGYSPGTSIEIMGLSCICNDMGSADCQENCVLGDIAIPFGDTYEDEECGICLCLEGDQLACADECIPLVPEPETAHCFENVVCDEPAPLCDDNMLPVVENGCYSGGCIDYAQCDDLDRICNPPEDAECSGLSPSPCGEGFQAVFNPDAQGVCEVYCAPVDLCLHATACVLSSVSCEVEAPECPAFTVPSQHDDCFTGQCVPYDSCAPIDESDF